MELFIPIIISNIAHMFVVKKDLFKFLKIPVFTNAFGENKTYRGFVFVGLLTGILQFIFNGLLYKSFAAESFGLGLILGLTYMFSELPNSFLKRRLGIRSGEKPQRNSWLFTILDKTDSTFGVCLVFILYKNLPSVYFLKFFTMAFLTHLFLSKVLHQLRIKESL